MTTEIKRLQFIDGINVNTPTQSVLSIMPSTPVSTTPYIPQDSDSILYVDTTVGNITINLQSVAVASMLNKILYIKKTTSDVNTVIIDASGAELIEGATTYTISKENDAIAIHCNGVNWKLIADLKTLHVDLYSNQTISGLKSFSNIATFNDTTESTDKDTGGAVFNGGVGIEKRLNVGGDFRTNGNATIDGDLTVQGNTTTINTATLDVEDKNITINKGGNQATADDAAGLTVEMSDATHAKLLYDKDLASKWKLGESGTEKEVVTVSDTQALTNKTIAGGSNTISGLTHGSQVDNPSSGVHGVTGSILGSTDTQDFSNKRTTTALNFSEVTTPSTPSAGTSKLYPKSDGNFYKISSDGIETLIGTGAGGASSGLITGDSNIPVTSIGSWLRYKDAAGTSPVDMTDATGVNITLTRNTTNPISSTADFLLTKDAANRQGEGISLTLTSIPNKYKSRACIFRFKYFTSSTYVDNAVGLFVYDITGAVVYQLNPLYLKKSGLIESSFAEIQLPNTLTSGFRIGFHIIGTDTTAYTINFSEFTFDEKVTSQNSSETDWKDSVITSNWDAGLTYTHKKERRKGPDVEYSIAFKVSGAVSGTLELTLPYTVDTTNYNYFPLTGRDFKSNCGGYLSTGGYTEFAAELVDASTTKRKIQLNYRDSTVTANAYGRFTNTAPITISSTNSEIQISFKYPVQGWSAGTQISDIYTGRQVAAYATAQIPTGTINGSDNIVKFGTITKDLTASYNTSTGLYSCPTSGFYRVSAGLEINATYAIGNIASIRIGINGANIKYYSSIVSTLATAQSLSPIVSGIVYCNAGDTIGIYSACTGTSPTFTFNNTASNFAISLDQSSNQPLASEKVIAKYQRGTAQTITASTYTVIDFSSRVIDTHNAVVTGANWRFIAPRPGYYRLNATCDIDTNSWTIGDIVTTVLTKNNSSSTGTTGNFNYRRNGIFGTISAPYNTGMTTAIVYLGQGEYIDYRLYRALTSATLNAVAEANWIEIESI